MASLSKNELKYLEQSLLRKANTVERNIVSAEWSEHCSYKSSKKLIRQFPTGGSRIIVGPGYDAGVIDAGDGFVLTVHIESHNHPSAVEPYGGAATGVGGVLRDIISMGTRPIALLDGLRFSPLSSKDESSSAKAKWLFKNVVKGIADYGNCVGIPTVGGEVEFDASFEDYCLVDVASVGFGRRDELILNSADLGDLIVLVGGSTGRDGIGGAAFASKSLAKKDRSAVQIPDPFMEKLLLEATMEAISAKCLKAIKDLGGGGLSCCLSEMSDSLEKGFEVEISKVRTREIGMTPSEIMVSESQERMMFITDAPRFETLTRILEKFELPYSVIGKVQDNADLVVLQKGRKIARMPSRLVAHAPLLDWPSIQPKYLDRLRKITKPKEPPDMGDVLLSLLAEPTIASKRWIYEQYDNEVGIRTVTKPGESDAAVLKLDNGRFVAVKLDGNSKQCYVDPYSGVQSCLSEGYRNIVCSGAEPVGVVDHLQFASPEDPEIFWTFRETVNSIIAYCNETKLPVVGGKVSFYNETKKGPIKPSPVIGTIGLIEDSRWITRSAAIEGCALFLIGETKDEMGGSEYYESYHETTGGNVPTVDTDVELRNANAVSGLIHNGIIECAHDCSKGGLGVAIAEMSISGRTGIRFALDSAPAGSLRLDELLFSESNSRYLVGTKHASVVTDFLRQHRVKFGQIGEARGQVLECSSNGKTVFQLPISSIRDRFESLAAIME